MMRPRSSLATLSSNTEAVSPCVSFTSTASGLLTSWRARYRTSSFMVSLRIRRDLHATLLDQLGYCRAWPCATLEPCGQAFGLEFDARGLLRRIIYAHLLQPTPITGISPVGDDDAVKGIFLATVTSEANDCSHDSFYSSPGVNQPIPGGMPLPAKRATCFIIFLVCWNCLRNRLTSATD